MGFWSKHPGRHKENLSKKENRLSWFYLPLLVFFIFLLMFTTGAVVTEAPGYCRSCHEMEPEYQTWQATAHQNIKCVNCHRQPGLSNLITYKVSSVKEIFRHYTGFNRPIKTATPIGNKACEVCHSFNRTYTPSGDIIIPHDRHKARGIACVDCHAGVAHGKIAQRGVTNEGELAAWTLSTAKQETPSKYTNPSMSSCMECHYKKKITTECKACHRTIMLPADHRESKWLAQAKHGLAARRNLSECNRCHSYSIEVTNVSTKDKIAQYAQVNSFCAACHMVVPPSHKDKWLMYHKEQVKVKGQANCLICHNEDRAPQPERVSAIYCNKCHGADIKHPDGWLRQHPQIVKTEGITKKGCFECHDSAQCSNCHTNPAQKPF